MGEIRDASRGPLHGVSVIELGGEIAAAYATKLLADLGADVIKVEPPTGDPLRAYGPVPANAPARGGVLFQYLNSGKRSAVLDPAEPRDRARFASLSRTAALLVENLGCGAFERTWPG